MRIGSWEVSGWERTSYGDLFSGEDRAGCMCGVY